MTSSNDSFGVFVRIHHSLRRRCYRVETRGKGSSRSPRRTFRGLDERSLGFPADRGVRLERSDAGAKFTWSPSNSKPTKCLILLARRSSAKNKVATRETIGSTGAGRSTGDESTLSLGLRLVRESREFTSFPKRRRGSRSIIFILVAVWLSIQAEER